VTPDPEMPDTVMPDPVTDTAMGDAGRVAGWPRRTGDEPIGVLAHRGGTGPWRENTLEAFAGALGLGADGVELDVRRTADGRLVVHHDAEIPGCGVIRQLGARELPDWVPGLDEALSVCRGAIVNVEIKNSPIEPGSDPPETVAAEVVTALSEAGVGAGGTGPAHVVVSSFWPANLVAVRAVDPLVVTGLLVHPSFDATEASRQAETLGCRALNPFHAQVTPALVDLVHRSAMALFVWTVNEPDDLASMAVAGVDAVISDRVTEARSALGRR
jgi:glycerophosphoryl diester phosphodiesterase